MRIVLACAALAIACSAGAAPDRYLWSRLVEAEPREIRIVPTREQEIRRLARRYGERGMPRREILGAHAAHRGFTLLYRSGGELYCRIHLSDYADAETLIHELRHCLGWGH